MRTELKTDHFNPRFGTFGTNISIELAKGELAHATGNVMNVLPGTLVATGGVFIPESGAGPHITANIKIVDHAEYTKFSIEASNKLTPYVPYKFVLSLSTSGKKDFNIDIASKSAFTLVIDKPINVGKVTPDTISLEHLTATVFTVTGTSFEKLNTEHQPTILSSPPVLLKYLEVKSEMLQLSVQSFHKTLALKGAYPIDFRDMEGHTVVSRTKITIEK